MAEESRDGGYDDQGFPYYIWRESADNRLSLSRPRYCCVAELNGELTFQFFDPSKDLRPSLALFGIMAVGAVVVAAKLWEATYGPLPPPRPYHLDESNPPFLNFIGTIFLASSMGGIVAVCWYVVGTLARWLRGRFPGDGRLTVVPWSSLLAFNVMNAADTAAGNLEKVPHASYGLGAAFDNGFQVALTANPWNYELIATRHAEMTAMFIANRAHIMRRWKAAPVAGAGNGAVAGRRHSGCSQYSL